MKPLTPVGEGGVKWKRCRRRGRRGHKLARANADACRSPDCVLLGTEAGALSADRIAVYDVLGREVAMLVDGPFEAGHHEVTLDGAGLPSGTYLVRARFEGAGGQRSSFVRQVTLLK